MGIYFVDSNKYHMNWEVIIKRFANGLYTEPVMDTITYCFFILVFAGLFLAYYYFGKPTDHCGFTLHFNPTI